MEEQQVAQNSNIVQKSNGNSTIWVVVGAVVLVLVILGAAYWYINQKGDKVSQQAQNTTVITSSLDALDKELNSIDTGNIDSDLADIDKDLQIL